ncbi:hypothetical protein ACIQD3_23745 [Peribacillus loiseleuriae]|uniref:hypothetical protein n=1 Tax=Peribacillus loiseleuriae TaxID=1679170 RepID=UPI00381FA5A4
MNLNEQQLKCLLDMEYRKGRRDGHEAGEKWAKDYIEELKQTIIYQDRTIAKLQEQSW